MHNVSDVRSLLLKQYEMNNFVTDKSGVKMIEIIGESFRADEPTIFCKPNEDYIKREIEWYESQSLKVDDIPGGAPAIWKQVSSTKGEINSNYGWCIYSEDNYEQYLHVLTELTLNPESRRGEMIYTRPRIQLDYNRDGMSDFICTDAVSYFIRDNRLIAHVKMRSNDAIFGYRNDYAWQRHVQAQLANDLKVPIGDLIWSASSLHVYERHFNHLEDYLNGRSA